MADEVQKFPVDQTLEGLKKIMTGAGAFMNFGREIASTKKLHGTTDAMVWAEEWCKVARELRDRDIEIIDEGWMVGWFANAFVTQENHDRRVNEENGVQFFNGEFEFDREEDGSLSLESAVFQALGYASMCWSKVPKGTFESDKAIDVGNKLVEFIKHFEAANCDVYGDVDFGDGPVKVRCTAIGHHDRHSCMVDLNT